MSQSMENEIWVLYGVNDDGKKDILLSGEFEKCFAALQEVMNSTYIPGEYDEYGVESYATQA